MSRSVIICVCPMPNDYVERRAALTRAEKVATYRRDRSNAGLGPPVRSTVTADDAGCAQANQLFASGICDLAHVNRMKRAT